MAHVTHYEVQVKQKGRWEIHARHSATEKDAAIEEAKALDKTKHVEAVKVIQEIYNPDDGTSKEYSVYAPGQQKYRPPGRPSVKSAPDGSKAATNARPRKKQQPSQSFSAILFKIIAITVFSTIVGALFTWFVSMILTGTTVSENAQINIMIITFLATFVMSAIPMAIVFLNPKK